MQYPTIQYVKVLPNHRLFLIFDTGDVKIYDFKNRLSHPNFQTLSVQQLFDSVHVEIGGYGMVWNDELGLSEYELWENAASFSSVERIAAASIA